MSDTSIQLVPKHIAVIMDGNGRWAKSRGKLRPDGHRAGVERVRGLVEGCLNTGVEVLTLFAFSSENWRRPKLEVATIMQLFMQGLKKETPELHRQGVQLKFIGDWGPLSTSLKKVFSATEALTAGNSRLKLRIAVNYGGRWEIVEAAKRL
ncbi:MAG: di-trans,poly-cis-decaprenylcistransferase, partial [Gammaproteobacteria bacterium]|nr:di-trans,poly-cis-decaprenylcistransferase [Gammaproteobacteria bacterium]